VGLFGRDAPSTGTLTDVRVDSVELPELRVVVTPARGATVTVPLGVSPVVVGTDDTCDVVLDDPRVSRRHCALQLESHGIVLRDLGSKNGTMVGDVAVGTGTIKPGTKITLGGARLVVESGKGRAVVPLSRGVRFGEAFGASVAMRALFARLEHAAQTDATVLLFGESGTGKELLAHGIHDRSPRRERPFIVFDCSAVAPALVESELFGHQRGAFTGADRTREGLFEQAHGGTLFIDELGELPLDLQPKLLRALESRQVRRVGGSEWIPVDVRVVAATHRDLQSRVRSGEFRADLWYRLAVLVATVPALRERKDDIQPLVEHFLASHRPPRTLADLPPNVIDMLRGHDWPGNVRELRNTVARLVLLGGNEADLPPSLAGGPALPAPAAGPRPIMPALVEVLPMPLREARDVVVEHFERAYLAAKLNEHAGNVSRAAEAIGVSRQFMHRLIERYGLKARSG
jgi:transcriptional regulator with PAS, ATPase and Fis domain